MNSRMNRFRSKVTELTFCPSTFTVCYMDFHSLADLVSEVCALGFEKSLELSFAEGRLKST